MKLGTLFALLCVVGFTGNALAGDSTGWTIPEHTVRSLWLETDGGYSYQTYIGNRSRGSYGNPIWSGRFSGSYFRVKDSDLHQSGLAVTLSAGGTNSHIHSDSYADDGIRFTKDRMWESNQDFTGTVRGDVRLYVEPVPLCFMGGFVGRGLRQQTVKSEVDRNVDFVQGTHTTYAHSSQRHYNSWKQHYDLATRIGIGFGKVRDASAVYDVLALEQRLLEEKVITRTFSDQARRRLAEMMNSRGGTIRLKPGLDRAGLEEIRGILRGEGILTENPVDDLTLHFLVMPYLQSQGVYRSQGWFVGVQGDVKFMYKRSYSNSSTLFSPPISSNNPWLYGFSSHASGMEAEGQGALSSFIEYHKPLNLQWQLDAEGSFWYYEESWAKTYKPSVRLRAMFLPNSRWIISGDLQEILRHRRNDESPTGYVCQDWYTRAGTEIRYCADSNLDFSVTASYLRHTERSRYRRTDHWASGSPETTFEIQIGILYHLSGRLFSTGDVMPAPLSGWPQLPWEYKN